MQQQLEQTYWDEYTNLQHIKHEILGRYLGAWYAILARGGFRTVAYFETHAGRGRHVGGQRGSPLVAIQTLLEHTVRDDLFRACQFLFRFIEKDETNAQALQSELDQLGQLPKSVQCRVIHTDYEPLLDRLIEFLESGIAVLPKSFFFVDPFGYSLPTGKLARIVERSDCEMFVNLMWRFVDMALADATKEPLLEQLFGSDGVAEIRLCAEHRARCDIAIAVLARRLGVKHHLSMKMLAPNGVVKYVLLHGANHPRAFEVMKSTMWSVVPEGGFHVWQSDDPKQEILIDALPNLAPLARSLWNQFAGKTIALRAIQAQVAKSLYLERHLTQLLGGWLATGNCQLPAGEKKLIKARNPLISFVRRPEL